MTRINQKYTRVYCDGYDISGYANQIGALDWSFAATPQAAFSDACLNAIAGKPTISAGDINAFLDNDTAGLTALTKTGQGTRNVMVAFGTTAVPIAGQPVFAWKFEQTNYKVGGGDGFAAANLNIGNASYASTLAYAIPWGFLIHPNGVETAVNTAIGIDDYGAATALGGIFIYHLHSSNGTVTLKAQDAATNTNPSFSDITSATSGSIDATSTPQHGMIALGTTAAVRQFIRWQLVLGTASTCTFTVAFIRNLIS